MDEIPFISGDYKTDQKMIKYCDENKEDYKCGCIIIPEKIYLFMKSSVVPYYCWYNQCKKDDVYQTSEIVEEKKLCKLNLCEISVTDLSIKNGHLKVENDCASTINPSIQLSQSIISMNIFDIPNMFVSFLIPISLILLIFLWDGIEISYD